MLLDDFFLDIAPLCKMNRAAIWMYSRSVVPGTVPGISQPQAASANQLSADEHKSWTPIDGLLLHKASFSSDSKRRTPCCHINSD